MLDKWEHLKYLEQLADQIADILDRAGLPLTPDTALALAILTYKCIKVLNPSLTHDNIKSIIASLLDDYAVLNTKLENHS